MEGGVGAGLNFRHLATEWLLDSLLEWRLDSLPAADFLAFRHLTTERRLISLPPRTFRAQRPRPGPPPPPPRRLISNLKSLIVVSSVDNNIGRSCCFNNN